MRTITLELLRHGTTHGQLLSPLTPYLALCENHAAITVHLPFEHNQFLYRLSALGYQLDDPSNKIQSRIFQLQDTARVLSEILAEIPGLTAESNKQNGSEDNLTHLRLIISASELALLPFELALSPNGVPGAGQHLLLQPQTPICLTREIRRVGDENIKIPKVPKILFIAAAPRELRAKIPVDEHLLVLRRLINPWMKYYDKSNKDKRRERVEEHLHFLPNASIEAIETACASEEYTHIHILAHGVEQKENYDTRFRLALHDRFNPEKADYISGARLATALRASMRPDNMNLALPVVVTLASCDSGNVGSVAGAGSSIAHALHEAGIPMVVAGQFPLSFEGSIRLAECLYQGLLWGTDPRRLLYDLRRRLYAQFEKNHDWASLVAYVSLPSDFDQQLQSIRIDRASKSIDAAMTHSDEATRQLSDLIKLSPEDSQSNDDNITLVESALKKIEEAKKKLERLLKSIEKKSALINGRLASTEKRQAEVLFRASEIDKESKNSYIKKHNDLLQKARDYYWDSFMQSRTDSWAVVQYLSLTLVMRKSHKDYDFPIKRNAPVAADELEKTSGSRKESVQKDPEALWSLAHLLSLYDLNNKEPKSRAWAYGNLIELYLISMIMDLEQVPEEEAKRSALAYTDALVDTAGRDSFEVYSTRRQILRYLEWFSKIAEINKPALGLAAAIFVRFPKEVEEKWK